ncbi:FAD-dependent thymidylate synthase [Prescottella equi]|uniref:FAD-dependent thymidylate synthase n=1 Tax=Rhodococcus hoagii TaxID=43767 RepID=UPI0037426F16
MDLQGPRVQLVASTVFSGVDTGDGERFEVEDTFDGGSAVAEAAGRACYQSWNRPNPRTATNADYLNHILSVGHESVLEHGTATFYVTGISRACTHELIRHRHLSYSQLSQRFVNEADGLFVMPPLLDQAINDPDFEKGQNLLEIFADTTSIVQQAYCDIADLLDEYIEETFEDTTLTQARKMSREAARSILPNASETRLFVTGNYRAWRDVLVLRGTVHADREIRAVAVLILRELHKLAPNVFGDLKITPQGTIEQTIEVAA